MSRTLMAATLISVLGLAPLEAQMVSPNAVSPGAGESSRSSSPAPMTCPASDTLVPSGAQERHKYKLGQEYDRFKDRREVAIPMAKLKGHEYDFEFQAGVIAVPSQSPLLRGTVFLQFWSYQNRSSKLAEAFSPMHLLFAEDRDLNFLVDDTLRLSLGVTEYQPDENWMLGSHNVHEYMTIYPSFDVLVKLARGQKVEGKLGSKEFSVTLDQIVALRDLVRFAMCGG